MPAWLRPCDVFARTYTHAQGWTAVCVCVCVFVWLGKLGGRSNRSRTRTIPTTRTQTRTRAEPNRTAPHRTTLSPFRRSDTRQTVANRLTSKRVLGVVCSPNNNNKNSSYDCETHTHSHTYTGTGRHTHTRLSDMCTLIWIWWEISISRD